MVLKFIVMSPAEFKSEFASVLNTKCWINYINCGWGWKWTFSQNLTASFIL